MEIGEHLDAYASVHQEFIDVFEEQEKSFPATNAYTAESDIVA
jgi:hypothetical protein